MAWPQKCGETEGVIFTPHNTPHILGLQCQNGSKRFKVAFLLSNSWKSPGFGMGFGAGLKRLKTAQEFRLWAPFFL
jgi:hypothetical protein